MTLAACRRVMLGRSFSAHDIVRIVAGDASQSAAASLKTLRPAQTISRSNDLEFIVGAGIRRVVKVKHVVGQRLAGLVGERSAIESHDGIRQAGTRRFEMALHADFDLSLRAESRRIDDRFSNVFCVSPRLCRRLDVFASWTVTPLAIDAFGNVSRKYRFGARFSALRRYLW